MAHDAEQSNAERAVRAEQAVRHYSRTPGYSGKADYEADITDLLTDLRHFCVAIGLKFDEIARRSKRHYEAESKGPNRRRMRNETGKLACPSCGARLDYHPDQDGSCDWECPHCGWRRHDPGPAPKHQEGERTHGGTDARRKGPLARPYREAD